MKRTARLFVLGILLAFCISCAGDEQAKQKANVHFGLGYNQLRQGNATTALREFLEAEKLNPQDPEIQYGLGMAYNAKGRYPVALEHYRKALELNPKYTEVHNAMGATYLEMGKWDEAIQEFSLVLKDLLYLTPFYALNNLGYAYYKKGNLTSAIESTRKPSA